VPDWTALGVQYVVELGLAIHAPAGLHVWVDEHLFASWKYPVPATLHDKHVVPVFVVPEVQTLGLFPTHAPLLQP
jgi:hypothetical protein